MTVSPAARLGGFVIGLAVGVAVACSARFFKSRKRTRASGA